MRGYNIKGQKVQDWLRTTDFSPRFSLKIPSLFFNPSNVKSSFVLISKGKALSDSNKRLHMHWGVVLSLALSSWAHFPMEAWQGSFRLRSNLDILFLAVWLLSVRFHLSQEEGKSQEPAWLWTNYQNHKVCQIKRLMHSYQLTEKTEAQ